MGKRKLLFMKNGGMIVEEAIACCNGRSNPIRTFTLKEVRRGTDKYDFRHLLVWDAHHKLYQGFLQGRRVSIKKYEDSFVGGLQGIVRDIVIASNMSSHKNVLRLLGCCLDTEHPLLVYEFVGDTVLARCLNMEVPREGLGWKQRIKIAMDIASVVAYLHTGFLRPIVHRDIKASSVLLDRNGVARLTDFSLAVVIPLGGLRTSAPGRDTFGAPEYVEKGYLTEKVDVYLFGLFLFHLLAGYNVNRVTYLGCDRYAVFPGRGRYKEETKRFIEIVDRRILDERMVDHGQLVALWELALGCVDSVGEDRPTMVDVAKQLRLIYRSGP